MAMYRSAEKHEAVVAHGATEVLSIALRASAQQEGSFAGLASVYGSTAIGARGPTRFARGAFTETLSASGGKIPLLWQHDQTKPVGVITSLEETDRGLELDGKITLNTFGKDVLALMRDGAVTGLSIGFDAVSHRYEKHGGANVRIVTKANLHETSLVTFPADKSARLTDVHSAAGIALSDVWSGEQRGYLSEMLRALLAPEVHVGKVISARNRSRLRDAFVALFGVLAPHDAEWVQEAVAEATKPPAPPPPTPEYPAESAPQAAEAARALLEVELAAAELELETLGDEEGHPFRGNQWTPGGGSGGSDKDGGGKDGKRLAEGDRVTFDTAKGKVSGKVTKVEKDPTAGGGAMVTVQPDDGSKAYRRSIDSFPTFKVGGKIDSGDDDAAKLFAGDDKPVDREDRRIANENVDWATETSEGKGDTPMKVGSFRDDPNSFNGQARKARMLLEHDGLVKTGWKPTKADEPTHVLLKSPNGKYRMRFVPSGKTKVKTYLEKAGE